MTVDEYKSRYQKHIDFITKYKKASNAATGSEVDSNANVESKISLPSLVKYTKERPLEPTDC